MILKKESFKNKKWVIAIAIALTLLVASTGSLVAYAADATSKIARDFEIGTNKSIEVTSEEVLAKGDVVEITEGMSVEVNAVTAEPRASHNWIEDEHYTGKGYDRPFTITGNMGDTLNIYVKNNANFSANFRVKRTDNSQDFGSKLVGGNSNLTRTFTMNGGRQMVGTWQVLVTDPVEGRNLDINVSARSFDS